MKNIIKEAFFISDCLITEEKWNNLLIDMWIADKERERNIDKPISAIAGKTVTITISKKDQYNPL